MGIDDKIRERIEKGINLDRNRGGIHDVEHPLVEVAQTLPEDQYLLLQELIFSGADINRDRLLAARQAGVEAKNEQELRVNGITESQYIHLLEILVERQHEENEKLKNLVTIDDVTEILNRRGLDMELAEAKVRLEATKKGGNDKRESHQGHILFFLIDVDNFKIINDLYGHPQGDEVLKLVAKTLKDVANERGGKAARYGGDEFAILQESSANFNVDDIKAISTRIQEKINPLNFIDKDGKPTGFTISIGGSVLNAGEEKTIIQLKEEADVAMYNKKKNI
jgi:diguanylate cyclase (GGDEF)-like protein